MELTIHSDFLVRTIKENFNKTYPFLKLEFYRDGDKHKMLRDAERLYIKSNEALMISIEAARTLKELKNDIEKMTGYTAQIFRRSGNVWIETSLTDDWSLERQNKEGELFNTLLTR